MGLFKKLDGELMIEIGGTLKQLRKSKRYSQHDLADQIGVSRKHIIDIEAGRGTSLLVFIKILKAYNKSEKLIEVLSTSPISPKEMFNRENK